jgi:hypothetical protein
LSDFIIKIITYNYSPFTAYRDILTRKQQSIKKPTRTFHLYIVETSGQLCWKLMVTLMGTTWQLIRRHPLIPTDRSLHFGLPSPPLRDYYRSRKKQEDGENYIIRASIICAPHLMLLEWVVYVG